MVGFWNIHIKRIVYVLIIVIVVLLFARLICHIIIGHYRIASGSLYFEDSLITDKNVTLYYDYLFFVPNEAQIPVIKALEGMGVDVKQESVNVFSFNINDDNYLIDINTQIICKENDAHQDNYLFAEGGKLYISQIDNDILASGTVFMTCCQRMGINIYVEYKEFGKKVIIMIK